MLDQVMVRVAREGERVQPESIHRRHSQQMQIGRNSLEVGQVEGDEVVAQHQFGALGEAIQPSER